MTQGRTDPRVPEVWARLAEVTDPELDEPVTELGFVLGVTIEPGTDEHGATVGIEFRLPTYWCAANFAFLMADDMRVAVAGLPWVGAVRPRLLDHMYAEAVNEGVAAGRSFADAFGAAADGETLDAVRALFRRKAFQRRQEAVLRALLNQGLVPAELAGMTLAGLDAHSIATAEGARQKPRYLALRHLLHAAHAPSDPAFVTADGAPLAEAGFADYLARLRGVRINMEFNGAICRGLLAAREPTGAPSDEAPSREPGLADFLPGGHFA